MILFVNVFITDQKHPSYSPYNRGLLPPVDPYTVFKYSLASLAVIPWSKVIIYCQLDGNYPHHDDLNQYVHFLFSNPSLHLRRNTTQSEWQKALEETFSDDLVWFTGNHDHIFLDYDLETLNEIQAGMRKSEERFVSCYFSHWPELLRGLTVWGVEGKTKHYFTSRRPDTDSIQIVNSEVLKEWFWGQDYGNRFIPRTDHNVKEVTLLTFVPLRELCRHFDGYDRGGRMYMDINACPPLAIPPGFWEKDIQIGYGCPGPVTVDPTNPYYRCVNPSGVDLKCVLEDLPLFWRSRISHVEMGKVSGFLEARNEEVWRKANVLNLTIPRHELGVSFR